MGLVQPVFVENAGSPRYIPRYHIPRMGWNWASQVVLSSGRSLVMRETLFGGYTVYVTVKPWCWYYSSKTVILAEMFDELYVRDPGGALIAPGWPLYYGWEVTGQYHQPDAVFGIPGATPNYWVWQPTPPPPPSDWKPPYETTWPVVTITT